MNVPLSVETLDEHLDNITYKPGWEFEVYQGAFEGPHIRITTVCDDSYHPGEKVTLDVHSQLPPMFDLEYFEQWLLWRLMIIETHEAREFLRKDGKPIFDPHKENANRDLTFD